ncbi:hypothetical protein ACQ4WY_25595 [Janthinobacterium sp. LB2P49]|uniref:hypothetical protein n=1 Tax=Janthinobacterium sp. LB2P49 TaxID=3424198 RepID=UPI003F253EE7
MGIIIIVYFLFSSNAYSAFSSCVDKKECWPEDSANYISLQTAEDIAKIEKEIQTAAANLTKKMASFEDDHDFMIDVVIPAFLLQQSEGNRYVKYKCGLTGVISQAGGSWPSAHILECELNEKRTQLEGLIATAQCIDRFRMPSEFIDKRNCLNRIIGDK